MPAVAYVYFIVPIFSKLAQFAGLILWKEPELNIEPVLQAVTFLILVVIKARVFLNLSVKATKRYYHLRWFLALPAFHLGFRCLNSKVIIGGVSYSFCKVLKVVSAPFYRPNFINRIITITPEKLLLA
jgi:hypothetical protein